MFIIEPDDSILNFKDLKWVIEEESVNSSELNEYLNKIFAENETQKENEDSEIKEFVLDMNFDKFSVSENGHILLLSDLGKDMLLVGEDAEKLMPFFREYVAQRIKRLNSFFSK